MIGGNEFIVYLDTMYYVCDNVITILAFLKNSIA